MAQKLDSKELVTFKELLWNYPATSLAIAELDYVSDKRNYNIDSYRSWSGNDIR